MAGARDKKPVKVAPLPEGAGQRSGRQGLTPSVGAEGAGLDLGERFWAFRPPAGTGAESRERPPAASQPHSLRRGSPLAGRSASLRGLALASAPWPCPGPGTPRRVPDRPAAGAPPASVCLSDTPALRRRRRRAPPSSAALWRSGGNGLGTAVPQHTRRRPGGRARRSLRAGILPPTPRPPAPLPLDCGRRKPLQERTPARARPRRPAAAQILAERGRAGAAAATGARVEPAPRTVARAWGAGKGKTEEPGLSAYSLMPNYGLFPLGAPSLMCEGKGTKPIFFKHEGCRHPSFAHFDLLC